MKTILKMSTSADLRSVDPVPSNYEKAAQLNSRKPGTNEPATPSAEPKKPLPANNSWLYHLLTGTQKYSAFLFTAFLGLHATTVIVAPLFGMDAANKTLSFTRAIYHAPYAESILVYGAIVAHLLSGWGLRIRKMIHDYQKYGELKASKYISKISLTGMMFTPIIAGHIAVTRLVPLYVSGDSSYVSLDYIGHLADHHRLLGNFALFGIATITGLHVSAGLKKFLNVKSTWAKNLFKYGLYAYFAATVGAIIQYNRMGPTVGFVGDLYNQYIAVYMPF